MNNTIGQILMWGGGAGTLLLPSTENQILNLIGWGCIGVTAFVLVYMIINYVSELTTKQESIA